MKARILFLLLLVLLCVISGTVVAYGQTKVATTAAQFLGVGVGTRAIGMGGAFVAVANDPSALYWNPGAISRTGMREVSFEHVNWIFGTSLNWLGGVLAIDENNAVGLSIVYLDYGEEEVTTVSSPEGIGTKWGAADLAISASYARNLTDWFSIGGSAKFIQQRIWNESGTAFALDVGLLFLTEFNGLRIGMDIANFGTDLKMTGEDLYVMHDPDPSIKGNNKNILGAYETQSWPLPLIFRVGLAMDVVKTEDSRVTLAADAIHPNDNAQVVNLGAEATWRDLISARLGYRSLFQPDAQGGLTLGLGLQYVLTNNLTAKVDYSYQDFGLLNNVQRFSIGLKF